MFSEQNSNENCPNKNSQSEKKVQEDDTQNREGGAEGTCRDGMAACYGGDGLTCSRDNASLDIFISLICGTVCVVPLFLYFAFFDELPLLYTSLYAPIGALIRLELCSLLNPVLSPGLKLGTFLSNMLACLTIGICIVSTDNPPNFFLSGAMGSLSTVSSWVNDAFDIRSDLHEQAGMSPTNSNIVSAIKYSSLYYLGTVLACLLISFPFART